MDDLISRKALLEKAWEADTQCGYVQVVDVGDIEDAPVVDAAPVVHGRWVAMHYEGGILDSYGRGMTLRTENAQRLEIIKEIPIDRLYELAQAYRLLGNTVYEPNKRGVISTYKVISVHFSGSSILVGWDLLDGIYSNLNGFEISALGKTVFLTREAAEAALKEREDAPCKS